MKPSLRMTNSDIPGYWRVVRKDGVFYFYHWAEALWCALAKDWTGAHRDSTGRRVYRGEGGL